LHNFSFSSPCCSLETYLLSTLNVTQPDGIEITTYNGDDTTRKNDETAELAGYVTIKP